MRRVSWDDLERPSSPDPFLGERRSALTVGVFDGVHRGHRALIGKITAKAPELLPVAVTFRKSPKKLPVITAFEEKMALLEALGVELCVIIDFSEVFGIMSGRVFVDRLVRRLRPAYIALGTNFHCGWKRDTDAGGFKALAEERGIEAEIIPPVLEGGSPVSSTRIRAALNEGRHDEAALLLGRPGAAVETGGM
jgi:riboflavin kinase/FMN adenylyltransferase